MTDLTENEIDDLTENEIDELVISQADDDDAWEEPIYVMKERVKIDDIT